MKKVSGLWERSLQISTNYWWEIVLILHNDTHLSKPSSQLKTDIDLNAGNDMMLLFVPHQCCIHWRVHTRRPRQSTLQVLVQLMCQHWHGKNICLQKAKNWHKKQYNTILTAYLTSQTHMDMAEATTNGIRCNSRLQCIQKYTKNLKCHSQRTYWIMVTKIIFIWLWTLCASFDVKFKLYLCNSSIHFCSQKFITLLILKICMTVTTTV